VAADASHAGVRLGYGPVHVQASDAPVILNETTGYVHRMASAGKLPKPVKWATGGLDLADLP
jgi:hypothetical protein